MFFVLGALKPIHEPGAESTKGTGANSDWTTKRTRVERCKTWKSKAMCHES